MRKVAEDGISNIPAPRAKAAHMQWRRDEEETPQEASALYASSGAAGFRNTPGVPMLSVGCGPFPWRLPNQDPWQDDFL